MTTNTVSMIRIILFGVCDALFGGPGSEKGVIATVIAHNNGLYLFECLINHKWTFGTYHDMPNMIVAPKPFLCGRDGDKDHIVIAFAAL